MDPEETEVLMPTSISQALTQSRNSVEESQVHKEPDPTGFGSQVTWLMSPQGNRLHKICGHELDDGTLCCANAGNGTSHQGSGHCLEHETPFLPRLVDAIDMDGVNPRVIEIFKKKSLVDNRLMQTVDPEIQGLYAILEMQLSGVPEDGAPSQKLLQSIRSTMKDIASLKKERKTMQDKATLDLSTVQEFINQIMGVIVTNTNDVVARRVLHEILNTVVKPMRAEGRITGTDMVTGS